MSQKPIKSNNGWLVSAIKYGLGACLFMPLIVNGAFIFPYIFPKQALFQIVVEILLGLYIFLAVRDPRYRPSASPWLLKALLAYFTLMILSAILGLNAYHSFWSNFERMAGVISLAHYLVFLLIAVNVLKTKEEWYRFFDFSIIASFFEVIYALSQLAQEGSGRIFGTIGNASFLAGYMLINFLFALWLFLEKKDIRWRIFYGVAMAAHLFILYQTQTRGAMLALAVGLVALGFFAIFAPAAALPQLPLKKPARLRIYAAGLVFFVFLAGVLVWGWRHSVWIEKFPTLSRLANISFGEATSKTRLLAWRMSWQGFKEHPLLGWGPENYYVLFNKYYNPDLYPVESWFDRSHNAYLDVLVHTGLVGLTAYSAIFVLAFWVLRRSWREHKASYPTSAIFAVILVSYGIQNVFLFDTQVTLLMIFSILAFIVSLGQASPGQQQVVCGASNLAAKATPSAAKVSSAAVRPNYFFGGSVIFLLVLAVYFFNIKPGLASQKGIGALNLLQQGKIEAALAQFKEAYQTATFGLPEVAMRVNDVAGQLLNSPQVSDDLKKRWVELAAEGMKKSLQSEPLNVRFMMMLSSIYLAASQLDPVYLSEAEVLLQRALELSPTRQELYFYLGQLRMFQGREGEALSLFQKAVELNDQVALSHWNYGVMAIAVGQRELGEAEIKKARELGHPSGVKEVKYLINAYGKIGDWRRVVSLYQEWADLAPGDASPYAGLAVAYAQLGNKQKAKEAALQAAEINPSFQAEAEQFIKNLGI